MPICIKSQKYLQLFDSVIPHLGIYAEEIILSVKKINKTLPESLQVYNCPIREQVKPNIAN